MKQSQKFELGKKIANLDALYGVKRYVYSDGPAHGMAALDVRNGAGLEFTVLADRGLDIPFLYYKGVSMGCSAKPGLNAPGLYQEEGARGFLRRFFAGTMTTCGITYAGGNCVDEGEALGLHGPFSNTPASQISTREIVENDEIKLEISGVVKQACVFGENLELRRVMTVETERNVIHIEDTLTNYGFETQPLMMVYHLNFGYPMLDAGDTVYFNAPVVTPRNADAEAGMHNYDLIEEPGVGRPEQCYFHTGYETKDGFAMLVNDKLGIAGVVAFDTEAFPLMCQWKCMHAGDYALGLEPTVSGVLSRAEARENGTLRFIEPGETKTLRFSLIYTDDVSEIASYKAKAIRK